MCWCNPNIRTPNCGSVDCVPPTTKVVKTVTIKKERYEELLQYERRCYAFEAAGVDNWQGYDEAMDILAEMENEPTS